MKVTVLAVLTLVAACRAYSYVPRPSPPRLSGFVWGGGSAPASRSSSQALRGTVPVLPADSNALQWPGRSHVRSDSSSSGSRSSVPTASAVNTAGGNAGVSSAVAGLATTLRSDLPSTDNALLSPLGMAVVLAALQMGARGSTADELAALLGQGSTSDRAYWVQLGDVLRAVNTSATVVSNVANAIFLDKSLALNQQYAQDVRSVLGGDVFALDIAGDPGRAAAFVNGWVQDKTRGKIRSVLQQPPHASNGAVVASVLYFNAAWREQFPTSTTKRARFTVSPSEAFEVDMMEHESEVLHVRDSSLKVQVLGLPYKDEAFAMFVLLPDEHGMEGLSRLESQLSPSALLRLLSSARLTEIPYLLPRMRLEGYVSLRSALANAGVTSIFNSEQADLSGMLNKTGGATLFVDELVHRVTVDVTESGTEAAAATLALVNLHGPIDEFRANRPFLFLIQHRPTGVILFWGSVVRPTPNYPLRRKQ